MTKMTKIRGNPSSSLESKLVGKLLVERQRLKTQASSKIVAREFVYVSMIGGAGESALLYQCGSGSIYPVTLALPSDGTPCRTTR